jgi:hypothetical protein
MKALRILILSLMTAGASAGADIKPRGQGLPLPWPFPWAKECPVNWKSMEGRYVLAEDSFDEQVDIGMTILTDRGMRLISIARYSPSGRLLSDGLTFVQMDQKVIEFDLQPRRKGQVTLHALLKLHYSDWDLGCSQNKLVPILTLTRVNSKKHIEYRLVRVPPDNH